MLTPMTFAGDLEIFKTETPYELFGYPERTSKRITNCQYVTVDGISVEDVRSSAAETSLDAQGFRYFQHTSKCPLEAQYYEKAGSSLRDTPVVLAYLEETIGLVKKELGTDKVICFDWRFRRTGAPPSVLPGPDDTYDIRQQALPPGYDVHCDFSHQGGLERLELHLSPQELDAVKTGQCRARIVNFWRPLGVVKSTPLVITDRRTVLHDDLLEVEKVLPDKVERSYYVKHRPYHKFYYMPNQDPETVALFVTWDMQKADRIAAFPPHGAASFFADDFETNPRESLEVRLIVLG